MVGTRTWELPCKAAPNASAFSSPVMYSSQPEESTSTSSEAVIPVAIVILPFHAFGDSAQLLDGARLAEANRPVQDINVQLLTGPELKLLAHTLGNDYLEFGRHFDHLGRKAPAFRPGIYLNSKPKMLTTIYQGQADRKIP